MRLEMIVMRQICVFAAVTEDEIALALMEGDVVTTPPGSRQNQLSTNGLPDAETENDPLNYSMEETKYALWIDTNIYTNQSVQWPKMDYKTDGNIKNSTFLFYCSSKIREELGMKPLPRDKFPSLSSPSTRENKPSLKKVPAHL